MTAPSWEEEDDDSTMVSLEELEDLNLVPPLLGEPLLFLSVLLLLLSGVAMSCKEWIEA